MPKTNRYWTLITVFLIAIIIIGGAVIWVRYNPGQTIEISVPSHQEIEGDIYIGGAIINPSFYPLDSNDSIHALIQAAGGTTTSADLSRFKVYIPGVGDGEPPQRIDINRAEVWLLEALPSISETLAQRIIDYRQQNGPFASTYELTQMEGICITKYEQIKELITVADE